MRENKRVLPRYIDGRMKVGPFPIWGFVKFLPVPVLFALYMYFFFPTFNAFVIWLIVTALWGSLFAELRNRETFWYHLKNIVEYDGYVFVTMILDIMGIEKRIPKRVEFERIGEQDGLRIILQNEKVRRYLEKTGAIVKKASEEQKEE